MKPASMFAFTLLFSALTANAAGPSPQLTYQGKLTTFDGSAPQTGDVTIRFDIYNPAGDCLLFSEDQAVNLDSPPGVFSVVIGSGIISGTDPGIGIATTFKTSGVVRSTGTNCPSGYTSTSSDNRRLRITVTPNGGTAAILSPDQILTNVPQAVAAITAETAAAATTATNLQGYTPTTLETLFQSDFDSRYLGIGSNAASATTATSATTAGTAANFTGNLGGDVTGQQGSTVVVSIRGVPIATAAPTLGQVLSYNGSQWTPTTAAAGTVTSVSGTAPIAVVNGSTTPTISMTAASGGSSGYITAADYLSFSGVTGKVSKAGDTMTGALTVPNLTVNTGLAITSGTPALGKVLTSDASGNATWNSPATGVSTVSGSGVVNVVNGSTTPAISIAVANGSTNGYLSSTDFTTFTNKVSKSGDTMSGTLSLPSLAVTGGSPAVGKVLTSDASGNATWGSPALGVTIVSGSGVVNVVNGSTTPAISIAAANGSTNGYLSSTDFTTFTNKVNKSGDTMSGTLSVPSFTVTGGSPAVGKVLTSDASGNATWGSPASGVSTVSGSGVVNVVNGSTTPAISIAAANGSTNGYLSSTDFTTFTNKVNKSGDTMTGALTVPNLTVNTGLAITSGTPALGKVLTSDASGNATWGSPASGVSTVSGSGVVTVINGSTTPAISIAAANGSTNGYLSSTDFTTFTNKVSKSGDTMSGMLSLPSLAVTGGTPAVGKVLTSDATGNATWGTPAMGVTTVSGSGVVNVVNGSTTPSISIAASNGSTNGYLSSTDFTTFSNKVSKSGDTMSGTLSVPSFTVTGGAPALGKVLTSDASGNATWGTPAMGVTNVTGTGVLSVINGTSTPQISISAASGSTSGYLSSIDYTSFSSKLDRSGDTMTGALTVPNLTATSSVSTSSLSTSALTVSGGTPAVGRVLTSNASGVGTWADLPVASGSNPGIITAANYTTWNNTATNFVNSTSANNPNTLIMRDPAGDFSAGTVTSTGLNTGSISASSITSTGTITGANLSTAGNVTATGTVSATTLTGAYSPASLSGTVPIAKGGTGTSSVTPNAAIVANGTGSGLTSIAPGITGNVLVSNGTAFTSGPVPLQPIMHGMQVFSTSGTFTLPGGITKLYIKSWGGGGGGSGVGNGAGGCSGTVYWYGGSGAGYVEGLIDPAPASLSITVGTGGTAGVGASAVCGTGTQTADSNKGGDGTATSVTGTAVTITANGGKGAGCNQTFNAAPYPGGTGSGSGASFTQYFAITGGTSLDQSGGGTFSFSGASYGGSPSGFGAAGAGGRQCAGNGSAGAPGAVIVTW